MAVTTRQPPNIYIVGAQCTGKTTLVNALRAHFSSITTDLSNSEPNSSLSQPAIITEVARTVLKAHNFTAQDVRTPSRSLALQQLILQAQAAAERGALGQEDRGGLGEWFVSDRSGADPIAYAVRYVGCEAAQALVGSAEWVELRARMQESVVVVCEAGSGVAGWLEDDGVRLMPHDMEEWVGFHNMFCEFLDGQGVRYEVLSAHVSGREERVEFVLQRWRRRWRERKGIVREKEEKADGM